MSIRWVEKSESDLKCKNLLKKHINFYYCLLLYPFSVVTSTGTGEDTFVLRKNCIQQTCCICLHSCVFMFSFLYIRNFTKVPIDESPNAMFFIAEGCSEILRCFSFLAILWLKKKTILEALPKFNQQLNPWIVFGIYLLQAFIAVRAIASVVMYDFLARSGTNESSIYYSIISNARYIILLESHDQQEALSETTVQDVLLMGIYSVLLFSKEVLTQSADSLFWIMSMTAFLACRQLNSVNNDNKGSKIEVTKCFDGTKSLLHSINEITATYVMAKFLSLVPIFSGNGFYIFMAEDIWSTRILFISYVFTSFVPFLLAAEAHYLTFGILCYGNTTEQLRPIRGHRFFTVTYGLLGSICVVVVTYAILVLQFSMSTC